MKVISVILFAVAIPIRFFVSRGCLLIKKAYRSKKRAKKKKTKKGESKIVQNSLKKNKI
jgi:hypothetical protein